VFPAAQLPDKSLHKATLPAENALVGDFPGHLVQAPDRHRYGPVKATVIGLVTLGMCLTLAGATPAPPVPAAEIGVAGLAGIPAPPDGTSWAPAQRRVGGLDVLATAADGRLALHTAGGDMTFLPGVNLGSTTPGHQPGELSITSELYRRWFAAMGHLGIRVLRIYTIHPPAFYQELAAHNRAHPDRPLYLMQGVYLPDESYVTKGDLYDPAVTTAFTAELRDAVAAVVGTLRRDPVRGRASGTWDTDVTPWLAGWIIGVEWDPSATNRSDRRNARARAFRGTYFRSAAGATPTERWLAARMDELATAMAARRLSQPIAFVNWPTTDPLRHPEEPLSTEDLVGVDANRVQATERWPAGTFASYHAYPYYPDFQRHEPALKTFRYAGRADPYAGYLTALRRHHGDVPTVVSEFGVPSSIGSAHHGPLGRSQGDHSERDAMRIDAEMLRLIKDQGLAGGFLFGWADEWFKFTWNTVTHQDPERRQLWHDVFTNEQHFGLLAMDAAGQPEAPAEFRYESGAGWPARRVTGRVDESYVHLRIAFGDSPPGALTFGFDVLPEMTGTPPPGSGDGRADAALRFDLVARTGQAYLRDQLDPMPLDYRVPASARGGTAPGWKPFELIVNRELTIPTTKQKLPVEIQNAGALRYGDPADDSRSLWWRDGDDLVVRVPWALLGFADPSSHRVGVPRPATSGVATLTTRVSPGVGVMVSASGTDQFTGDVTWEAWNRPYWTERLKHGAAQFRDAALEVVTR
jgi:hypothetical protein